MVKEFFNDNSVVFCGCFDLFVKVRGRVFFFVDVILVFSSLYVFCFLCNEIFKLSIGVYYKILDGRLNVIKGDGRFDIVCILKLKV